jgi:hypothetical protein
MEHSATLASLTRRRIAWKLGALTDLHAAGSAGTREWVRRAGAPAAGALLATYLGGFGASHALAKHIGAWPSVLSVAAVSCAAS